MRRYFITGTDTDCGKTYVTTRLLDYFKSATAIKPVASGLIHSGDAWVNQDALDIQNKTHLSMERINPWRFHQPLSPHIAAQKEGVCLNVKDIADYCLNFAEEGVERLFIEGAGGLMVPLNEAETWVDFLQITRIPVLFVVGMRLGCINHSLLTQTAFKALGIQCLGWIANCLDPNMQALEENLKTLDKHLSFPRLATFDYGLGLINHGLDGV